MSNIRRDINLWQDATSGGWILEVMAIGGEWVVLGVFGTKQAAVDRMSRIKE